MMKIPTEVATLLYLSVKREKHIILKFEDHPWTNLFVVHDFVFMLRREGLHYLQICELYIYIIYI
jgi:hypothetical protein